MYGLIWTDKVTDSGKLVTDSGKLVTDSGKLVNLSKIMDIFRIKASK